MRSVQLGLWGIIFVALIGQNSFACPNGWLSTDVKFNRRYCADGVVIFGDRLGRCSDPLDHASCMKCVESQEVADRYCGRETSNPPPNRPPSIGDLDIPAITR